MLKFNMVTQPFVKIDIQHGALFSNMKIKISDVTFLKNQHGDILGETSKFQRCGQQIAA